MFKITPSGTLTTLYSFDDTDGAGPSAALIQATDANYYGTTSGGNDGLGTVFKITPGGILTTLHSFANTDGANPLAALIQATDGNFYGTTSSGGANNGGTVFDMTPTGKLTTLHNFCSVIENGVCADGNTPVAGLVQHEWDLLRDNEGGRGTKSLHRYYARIHRLRHGFQPVIGAWPVCGNANHIWHGGSVRQHSGDGPDGREQCHV